MESPSVLDGQWARLRSHKRVLTRVDLVVEWEEDRRRRSIPAFTVDVSHSGCLAVVGADLQLGTVKLINRETGREAEARLIWRDPRTWSAGFELSKSDASFWNL